MSAHWMPDSSALRGVTRSALIFTFARLGLLAYCTSVELVEHIRV